MLSVSAAPLPPGGAPLPVLALSLFASGILDPVRPGASSSTPVLPGAHPWQCGPPRFIVAVGRGAGETQRHAGVWGRAEDIFSGCLLTSVHNLCRTVVETVAGLVLLFIRLVLFMPPGSSVCYCRTHVAVCGHGAARSLCPPT